jgi:hypothetical protein
MYSLCDKQCFTVFYDLVFVDHGKELVVWNESKKDFTDPPNPNEIIQKLHKGVELVSSGHLNFLVGVPGVGVHL